MVKDIPLSSKHQIMGKFCNHQATETPRAGSSWGRGVWPERLLRLDTLSVFRVLGSPLKTEGRSRDWRWGRDTRVQGQRSWRPTLASGINNPDTKTQEQGVRESREQKHWAQEAHKASPEPDPRRGECAQGKGSVTAEGAQHPHSSPEPGLPSTSCRKPNFIHPPSQPSF